MFWQISFSVFYHINPESSLLVAPHKCAPMWRWKQRLPNTMRDILPTEHNHHPNTHFLWIFLSDFVLHLLSFICCFWAADLTGGTFAKKTKFTLSIKSNQWITLLVWLQLHDQTLPSAHVSMQQKGRLYSRGHDITLTPPAYLLHLNIKNFADQPNSSSSFRRVVLVL